MPFGPSQTFSCRFLDCSGSFVFLVRLKDINFGHELSNLHYLTPRTPETTRTTTTFQGQSTISETERRDSKGMGQRHIIRPPGGIRVRGNIIIIIIIKNIRFGLGMVNFNKIVSAFAWRFLIKLIRPGHGDF